MATIVKRTDNATGAVRYQVRVRMKGYPAQSATFPRLTEAKKWATQTEAAVREGRHFATTEAKRHTLADLLDWYVRDVLPTKKPKTQGPQVQQLAWWRARIGDYTLADCTPALVAECRDELAREPVPSKRVRSPALVAECRDELAREPGPSKRVRSPALVAECRDELAREPDPPKRVRSPATVVRYLAVLSHAFTLAVKEKGWIETNPLVKVTKPKEPRGRVRFLTDEERDRLLDACRGSRSPDLYPAVVLALSTGARREEVMGLRWGQIDLARRVAVLHETKNGERRVLPLAGHALETLRERAKIRRLDTDLVFPSRAKEPGEPTKPVDLRTPFETALKRAGITDFRWHDLRHTAASYLAMNGASLAEIAEILGHKTLAMVKRYAHLSEAHTAAVVERMNARLFGR